MTKNYCVLCVDDNEDNAELINIYLEFGGFEVIVCSTAEECLQQLKKREFAAIILDYRLGESNGLKVCAEIKRTYPTTPIIFFSGDARNTTRNLAIKAGADTYLVKPEDWRKLFLLLSIL
jgi:DNA-binding response OmpR family regulator